MLRNQVMLSLALIFASSISLIQTESPTLGGGIITMTSTMTTTVEVTYNYFTSLSGTTMMGGYLTTSTLVIPVTVTSSFSNFTSPALGPLPILGFDAGWIIVGLVLGILALYLIRRGFHGA